MFLIKVSAIHNTSRSWLRSSSTQLSSDPPLRMKKYVALHSRRIAEETAMRSSFLRGCKLFFFCFSGAKCSSSKLALKQTSQSIQSLDVFLGRSLLPPALPEAVSAHARPSDSLNFPERGSSARPAILHTTPPPGCRSRDAEARTARLGYTGRIRALRGICIAQVPNTRAHTAVGVCVRAASHSVLAQLCVSCSIYSCICTGRRRKESCSSRSAPP